MQMVTRDAVAYFGKDIPGVARSTVGVAFNVLNPKVIEAVKKMDTEMMKGLADGVRETVCCGCGCAGAAPPGGGVRFTGVVDAGLANGLLAQPAAPATIITARRIRAVSSTRIAATPSAACPAAGGGMVGEAGKPGKAGDGPLSR
jgi:hypothetical protein